MDLREKIGRKIRDLDTSIPDAGNAEEQYDEITDAVVDVVSEHFGLDIPRLKKLEPKDITEEMLASIQNGSEWIDSYGGRNVIVLRTYPTPWMAGTHTVEMMQTTGWKRESHMLVHGFLSRFLRKQIP